MNFEKLKETRQKRGLTLAQASHYSGYTASFLSQIERGLKEPSLTALRKLSDVYSIPLISLFIESVNEEEKDVVAGKKKHGCAAHVIRREKRKEIIIPKTFTTCEFITPVSPTSEEQRGLSGYVVKLPPGCWISEKQISHTADESIYVISGQMKAIVGQDTHNLNTGDSLYVEANVLHNFQNCGESILEIINYMPVVI